MPVARTITAAALAAAVVLTTTTLAGADPRKVQATGFLRDLQPAAAAATDGAHAHVTADDPGDGSTTVRLVVTGLDRAAAGTTLGAHVHSGPCVAGNGAAAGPHYNTTGGSVVDEDTEVWLDFMIGEGGVGRASATVPFAIPAGAAQSVVVHAQETQPSGAAGPRLACLPVAF